MSRHASGGPTVEALRQQLRAHLARNAGLAAVVLIVSLGIGMAGYHWLAPMPWIDAFVNAAMLLGGMAPIGTHALHRFHLDRSE